MKLLVGIIVFISISIAFSCFAQKKRGQLIPVINHSYKIDSVIRDLIDSGNGWVSKDKCLVVNFDKTDSVQFFSFDSFEKKEINSMVTTVHLKKEHIGFFALGSYKVF